LELGNCRSAWQMQHQVAGSTRGQNTEKLS
jgi:hypothetical protein